MKKTMTENGKSYIGNIYIGNHGSPHAGTMSGYQTDKKLKIIMFWNIPTG